MKAIVLPAPGDPDVLQCQDWPLPDLTQATDMRVRLKAAGVNPVDAKIRQRGPYLHPEQPAVLGLDGAGIVDAVGSAVRRFSVGDAVYFCDGGLGGDRGTYAEYAIVNEQNAVPKPAKLSFAEAAAAPLVLIAAWEALYDRARLSAGQRVLIHGGAGGVGHMAIQLSKLRGARVAATVSTEAKANFVTHLGADHCIYYPYMDFVTGTLAWTQGQGAAIALDTIGEPVLSRSFNAVQFGGDVITLLSPTAQTDWKTARARNLRVGFELMLTPRLQNLPQLLHHQTKILEAGARRFDAGQLHVHVDKTFPLAAAAAAHRWLESRQGVGKVVLAIDP